MAMCYDGEERDKDIFPSQKDFRIDGGGLADQSHDISDTSVENVPADNGVGVEFLPPEIMTASYPVQSRLELLFDKIFSISILITLAPLLLLIAMVIVVDSPGPILFRQRRRGLNGSIFWIYKFRSMYMHDGEVRQATKGDPRISPIGGFLRRTSLDELPQFINVLRGDMSIVGPRPHAIEHDLFYEPKIPNYMRRYGVKPGITGWAQVNGLRGETEHLQKMADRLKYDLYYLNNKSLCLDLMIILKTVSKVLVHKNAY